MDGIELQVYGHLLDQFWSPLTNDLTGPYGADTMENRMRFPLDVVDAIRKRVGGEFIVGLRYTADEVQKGGITPEEGLEISKRLAATGKVDFLNVIWGRIHTDPSMTDLIPIQGMKSAPHLDFAGEVRRATGMPTFHTARTPDVATARHAVKAGLLDMVGMTRAHMADPHIVRKIVEGREADIRPCVGATYCLDRVYQAGEALCIHNAATGRELTMPHEITKAETRKKIVIVGAGPAGLEAARVAAERGHEVTVFEAAAEPGGQVLLTSQSPRRREMMGIIDWRMNQCAAREVTFNFNVWAEVTSLVSDVVIVATGGIPNTELFEQKGNQPHVVTSWDIISGDAIPGGNILIYDESGDHPALQAAEIAANAGAKVEIMTPDRTFSPEVMAMNLVPYMRSLQDKDVTFTVTRRLLDVVRNGNKLTATIGTDYSDHTYDCEVDQVVVNYGTLPLDDLYCDLKPLSSNAGSIDYDALLMREEQTSTRNANGRFQLFHIGDAVSARNTHVAIYDALRLVKDI
ncbi:MAG: NADPH-dependent 2,4-dienoyl-CoA reductase/sulfur reductase-like enzyme [Octadecabacter sp.]|jgi:NADPH-dependent 2,4-dienoyl-CoA reductase/sulfur reductase-like enzyme